VVRDFLREQALSDHKVLAKYLKLDLLIVEDMAMKQLPKRSGEYLLKIIMRRYENRHLTLAAVSTTARPDMPWG